MKKFIRFLIFGFVVFMPMTVYAESKTGTVAPDASSSTTLPTVTVYATREANPGISVIDLDETPPTAPYADSSDYLQHATGVSAGRFGGHGLELVIRGQSQNQLNIIADDAYIFGGCPNRMDPPAAYTSLAGYDTVKVVRGYQSVLNGPGASGGSIILERAKPELSSDTSLHGNVSSGYQSNGDLFFAEGYGIGGNDATYARGSASTKRSGNYQDGDGNEVRSSFLENAAGVTMGLTPDDSHVHAGYDFHRVDDALFEGASMDSPVSEGHTFTAGVEREFTWEFLRDLDLSGYASLVDHTMDNYSLRTPSTSTHQRVDSGSETFGAKLKAGWELFGQAVDTIAEYRRNNRDATRYQGTSPATVSTLQAVMWPDITQDEFGLAAETVFHLGDKDRLVAGGRYDHVEVNYGRANEVSAVTGRSPDQLFRQFYGYGSTDQDEDNFGGLLRLEKDALPELTLFTGVSRSVRTADATERGLASDMVMMMSNQSWVGNPQIEPEKHHQLDGGFRYLKKDRLDIGASVYANYVEDFILRDSARRQEGIFVTALDADVYRNIDALLSGAELNGEWLIWPELTFTGNLTYTFGEDLDADRPLPQIPPLSGLAKLEWQLTKALNLGGSFDWAIKQGRVDLNSAAGTGRDVRETPGYAVLGLYLGIRAWKEAVVTVGVKNLLDENYAHHLNRSNISDPTEIQVNEPGRSFFVKGSISF